MKSPFLQGAQRGDSWGPRKLWIQAEGPLLSGQNNEFAGVVFTEFSGGAGGSRGRRNQVIPKTKGLKYPKSLVAMMSANFKRMLSYILFCTFLKCTLYV